MRVRYLVSNIRLGQSKLINPEVLPPGSSSLTSDTPTQPPSGEPKPAFQPMPQIPNPGAPSQMIQPEKFPVVNQAPALPVAPEVPAAPQPIWVNEGKNDLTRTLLATGTVAAIAAGFAFFR